MPSGHPERRPAASIIDLARQPDQQTSAPLSATRAVHACVRAAMAAPGASAASADLPVTTN